MGVQRLGQRGRRQPVGLARRAQPPQDLVLPLLQTLRGERGLLAPAQVPDQHLHPRDHAFHLRVEAGQRCRPVRDVPIN
jgi:hypothetical protein